MLTLKVQYPSVAGRFNRAINDTSLRVWLHSFRSSIQQDEEAAARPQLWVTWTSPGEHSVQTELEQT